MAEEKNPLHGSGTMTTQEIVQKSLAKSEPNEDWKRAYSAIYHALQTDKFRMFRHGDTLLFFKVEPPIASNIHIFSADDPNKLMEAFLGFAKSFKVSKYQKMTGRLPVKDTTLLRFMRRANNVGFNITEKPIYAFEGSDKVIAYDVVIEVDK
jgi:hypothetical protein